MSALGPGSLRVSAILTASVIRSMPLAALLWCRYSIRCNGGNVRSAPIVVQAIRLDSAVRHPPDVGAGVSPPVADCAGCLDIEARGSWVGYRRTHPAGGIGRTPARGRPAHPPNGGPPLRARPP